MTGSSNLEVTDLFAGAGGSSTGVEQVPGVHVHLAMNHWKLAVQTHQENHPTTDHDVADISQVDPRRYPTTDILWASPECFTAGHLVTTSMGQVPIEHVSVGMLVLTHTGHWHRVVRTQHRTADTVIVKGQGNPGIEVTPNHKFWTRTSSRVWQNGIRRYRREYRDPSWLPIAEAPSHEALWATPLSIDHLEGDVPPDTLGTGELAWWVIGRWLGDGSITFGRNHETVISCGFQDVEGLRARLALTGQEWHEDRKRTAMNFRIGDEKTRDWLQANFGHGAAGKSIPSWCLTMCFAHRRALLDGYISADGCVTQRRVHASTVSKGLAISVRILAEGLGHRVSMARDKRTTYTIEGRTGSALPQWVLHWEPRLSSSRSPEAFSDDRHAWSRVRSIEPGHQGVTVYNIEVEGDHSYVLDGIVVANCTNHSVAKGRRRNIDSTPDLFDEILPDEAAVRSRATMWDVPRFAEAHPYRAIIVENVVDAAKWIMFPAWRMAMDALGYRMRFVFLNSMHAGQLGPAAPQSRDRMYVVMWRKGERAPDLDRWTRPVAVCPVHGRVRCVQAWKHPERPWGRYRAQYVWRCPNHDGCKNAILEPAWVPAAAAIDWTQHGTRIGDRDRPLAAKTLARIQAGLDRWATNPMTLEAAGNTYDSASPNRGGNYFRIWPAIEPLRTLHTTASRALLVPVEGRTGKEARTAVEPLRTMTTRNETGVLVPPEDRGAFIVPLRNHNEPKSVGLPLDTIAAAGGHHAIVTRHNTSKGSGAEMSTPVREPLRTLTTTGQQSLTTWDEQPPKLEDCEFRMLTPHEISLGMAFPDDYILLGNKREQVRQSGNAVTPPAARDLMAAVAEALTGEEVTAA